MARVSVREVMARLPTADVRLRRWRPWQWARRITLAASLALTWLTPVWNRASAAASLEHPLGTAWGALLPGAGPGAHTPAYLGAPWTVNVLGLEFMDPLAALSLVAAAPASPSVLTAVAPSVLPTLLLVLLLGRFFCGWLCPYVPVVALTNAVRALLQKAGFQPWDLRVPPGTSSLVLLGLLSATALGGMHLAPLIYPPAAMMRLAWRAVLGGGLGAGAWLLGAAALLDVAVVRAGFCRHVCPGGALFRWLGRASAVRVQQNMARCTGCTVCNVACNMGQSPMTGGADAGCDRCGRCVSSCPTGALTMGVRRHARLPILPAGEAAR